MACLQGWYRGHDLIITVKHTSKNSWIGFVNIFEKYNENNMKVLDIDTISFGFLEKFRIGATRNGRLLTFSIFQTLQLSGWKKSG